MGKKKDKDRKNKSPEIITDDDELRLIIDLRETKKKYEELIERTKKNRDELNDALKQARLILRDMKQQMED